MSNLVRRDATSTSGGELTASAQTIPGAKTFTGVTTFSENTTGLLVTKWNASSALASSTASGLTPATAVLGLLRYNTSNGYGSTNTTIRRFSTLVSNTGSVTYADSSTAGSTFTITVSGIYAIAYSDEFSAGASMGLSKNSSQLTTNIAGITAADRLIMASASAANNTTTVSWTGYLDAGDVIRAHADATTSGASTVRATFTIQRIA
jgi:hypothetical protein